MQEQPFFKTFRILKIVQFCILVGIELTFFLILILNPSLGKNIYSNQPLFILCIITWIMMIFNLLCMFIDFWKLRSFALKSHALSKAAYLDSLTGIPNRHSLDTVFRTYTTPESLVGIGCAMFSISNLKDINERMGHTAGDNMIQNFCSMFEEVGDSFGFVGRNGGNEFIAVISNCDHDIMRRFLSALQQRISSYNKEHSTQPIELISAYTLNSEENAKVFTQLLTVTYNKLYHMS